VAWVGGGGAPQDGSPPCPMCRYSTFVNLVKMLMPYFPLFPFRWGGGRGLSVQSDLLKRIEIYRGSFPTFEGPSAFFPTCFRLVSRFLYMFHLPPPPSHHFFFIWVSFPSTFSRGVPWINDIEWKSVGCVSPGSEHQFFLPSLNTLAHVPNVWSSHKFLARG
jgi:hypothetical protein